jgi:uncharacterized membrane protein YfcA
MERDTVVGTFLLVTAIVILVPVLLQIRDGRFHWREVWGMFVLVAGFVIVGVGFAFFADASQRLLSLIGLVGVVFGLFVQHKRRDRHEEH